MTPPWGQLLSEIGAAVLPPSLATAVMEVLQEVTECYVSPKNNTHSFSSYLWPNACPLLGTAMNPRALDLFSLLLTIIVP